MHDAHISSATWSVSADPAAAHTPAGSAVQLVQLMLPSDCVNFDSTAPVAGGVIAKLMDSAAGICAAKYCHSNVVTASIDTVDFLRAVRNGEIVYVMARPTFTSSKSLEVECLVEVEDITGTRAPAAHAYFTFVSLDKQYKPQVVPSLRLTTPDDKDRFEQGRSRYEFRRAERAKPLA